MSLPQHHQPTNINMLHIDDQHHRNNNHQPQGSCCTWLVAVFVGAAAIFFFKVVPTPPTTPLASLEARSLLDNYNLYHLQDHAHVLKWPLSSFHIQHNMPQYRYYINDIEENNHQVQEAIKNVTLCIQVLSKVSEREIKGLQSFADEFQSISRLCRQDLETARNSTLSTLENYKRAIAFIGTELRRSDRRGKKFDVYTLAKTSNASASSLGWLTFLRSSRLQWKEDKTFLEHSLSRIYRFAIALEAMVPKRVEGVTPELLWEEVDDRAALCRSFEVVVFNVTEIGILGSSWVVATESDDGSLYLSWYNSREVK